MSGKWSIDDGLNRRYHRHDKEELVEKAEGSLHFPLPLNGYEEGAFVLLIVTVQREHAIRTRTGTSIR